MSDIVKLAKDRAMYLRGQCVAYDKPVPHGLMEMGLASVLFDDLANEVTRLREQLRVAREALENVAPWDEETNARCLVDAEFATAMYRGNVAFARTALAQLDAPATSGEGR